MIWSLCQLAHALIAKVPGAGSVAMSQLPIFLRLLITVPCGILHAVDRRGWGGLLVFYQMAIQERRYAMTEITMTELNEKEKSLKTLTTILYALYGVSVFFFIPYIVAIIINYVKKDAVAGTIYESHFRWQIRTFWFSLLWAVVGLLTFVFVIGFVVWGVAGVWYLYRVIKGFLNLNDNKPMYAA